MAWTVYSSTPANGWDSAVGAVIYDAAVNVRDAGEELFFRVTLNIDSPIGGVNSLSDSYNIPGFDDGYQPAGVNNPIAGDLGGGSGGGGPTRPTSGMLYPRGQG